MLKHIKPTRVSVMYTLHKTFLKDKYTWSDDDISEYTLTKILSYANARFTVQWDDGIKRDFFASVNRTLMVNANQSLKLKDWIKTIGEDDLVTTTSGRGLRDTNVMECYPLYHVASDTRLGSIKYAPGAVVPHGSETDIMFTTKYLPGDSRHPTNIVKNCMGVVNGVIYPLGIQGDWVYIVGGAERVRSEEQAFVNILDFSAIGGIDTYQMSSLDTTVATRTAKDIEEEITRVYIKFSSVIGDRIPCIVLDGFLHIMNLSYEVVDNQTIRLDVNHRQVVTRAASIYKPDRKWISHANARREGINVPSLDVNSLIKDLESFVVMVKTTDLAIKVEPIGDTGIPQTYRHYRIPKGFVMFETGELACHAVMEYNENIAEIKTMPNKLPEQVYETINPLDRIGYNENGFTTRDRRFKRAFAVELYSFA